MWITKERHNPNIIFLFLSSALAAAQVHASIDNDAQIIALRATCTEDGQHVPNCFTSSSAVTDWMKYTRDPAAGPLTIQVGPGTFGHFQYRGINDVSIQGSGPGQTKIQGINVGNTFNFNVQDLTVLDWFPAPVYWAGDGTSVWTNVHLEGGIYAWTETGCKDTTSRPEHRWFSSRLIAKSKTVYEAACSENWFFGSELVLKTTTSDTKGLNVGTHTGAAEKMPEIHLYGGVLRVVIQPGISVSNTKGVLAGNNAQVHIHGTGIDIIGNDIANNITALHVNNGGFIHANQSSYVLKTPAPATITRISNNGGTIKAPYLWERSVLDLGHRLITQDGADRVSDIICEDNACMPHTLVYSAQCNVSGPWFDTVTGTCVAQ